MSTSQRAALNNTSDAVDAERLGGGSLLLTSTETAPRGDIIVLERSDMLPRPEDIGAARLRALAARFAGTGAADLLDDDDGSLAHADEVIEPVSLTAIMALRRLEAPDERSPRQSDDTPPSNAMVAISDTSSPMLATSSTEPETLEVQGPPVPLRLTPISDAPTLNGDNPIESTAAHASDGNPLMRRIAQSDEPLMLADQSAADIRLVDLIRRQQTLLDQLHRFPSPTHTPAAPVAESGATPDAEPPSAPAEPSIVERLAPPPPPMELTFSGQPRAGQASGDSETAFEPLISLPPPIPAGAESRHETAGPHLPERAPIIIERARAERSGRYDPSSAGRPPSAVPAFAAGLAVALAVAGTLFYLL